MAGSRVITEVRKRGRNTTVRLQLPALKSSVAGRSAGGTRVLGIHLTSARPSPRREMLRRRPGVARGPPSEDGNALKPLPDCEYPAASYLRGPFGGFERRFPTPQPQGR